MSSRSDRTGHEQVLAALCSMASAAAGAEVDVRPLMDGLGLARRHVYSAVLSLCDEGLLEYTGAGPTVRVTAAGLAYWRRSQSLPRPS